MNAIRSHLHDVYSEEINKVALSAEDDKKVIIEDGIHTLAYGHYILNKKISCHREAVRCLVLLSIFVSR